MGAAFDARRLHAVDVHMTDIIERPRFAEGFAGLVACGGFSYGDVLGAGEGWAKSILFNARAGGSSARSSRAPDGSRSVCATAARCLPCLRN